MWLLDLYCCEGGATRGYQRAGFRVRGVDHKRQARYAGEEFVQADAIEYLATLIRSGEIEAFAGIHASPPCQAYVYATAIHKHKTWKKDHPRLIEPTRELLKQSGLPYVMENVPGAPLLNPMILCGTMFDLRVYRHRAFESSFFFLPPRRCQGHRQSTGSHRGFSQGEGFICVAGHNFRVADARRAMGIEWMGQKGLSQAIPPAYTEFIGQYLLNAIHHQAIRTKLKKETISNESLTA